MPDYGHDLQFGCFLTPGNADPQRVVELAQAAERAGLDLVTFQDHPYQPRFLDTWTLLSFVAARTERVHLAPNVLNLPLRQPAVVARAAASLDLLSGGRFELGLGSGAFWDAIEAMGGERLQPAQAVAATAEAIDVIRGIWDVAAGGVLRVPGTHHRVEGAKRGPRPAHDIAIWVGALKPRMLRLIGHQADGWLPSLGRLDLAEVPRANAQIDEAAQEAGRQPADVRRLLNVDGSFADGDGVLAGPPARWAERLAELTRAHGFATYILASDDAETLTRFAREVAPDTRERVARERGR
jgi:alkanesulfonate monooxygenase SsuD/methylene tetrahydromethanopterin reductase-like flavin-dependent oxidoreductase (luciferase family)